MIGAAEWEGTYGGILRKKRDVLDGMTWKSGRGISLD